MSKYRVPYKYVTTIIYEVEAIDKEHAMNLVYDDSNKCIEIENIEGDGEVYYPDIQEIK